MSNKALREIENGIAARELIDAVANACDLNAILAYWKRNRALPPHSQNITGAPDA